MHRRRLTNNQTLRSAMKILDGTKHAAADLGECYSGGKPPLVLASDSSGEIDLCNYGILIYIYIYNIIGI